MNNVTQIVQTVRQANWRVQRQWIGLFLLGLVLVAMVAGIYLNITVRATLAGREIQMLQVAITDNTRTNSDYETQLASLSSVESMQKRANAMGFGPADPAEITYVVVPGYTPATAINMSSTRTEQPRTFFLLPAYSESLFDWITRTLASSAFAGGQP
jgi:cell division protein FtsL